MIVRYVKLDYASVADTYEHVGGAMKFLQLIMFLEVMHPLFGYTKVFFYVYNITVKIVNVTMAKFI